VLKVGGSETQRARTIKEALYKAKRGVIYILPYFNKEQLSRVLETSTREVWWGVAREVLKLGDSKVQGEKTILEAFDRASDWELGNYIVP
jgi:hypothetical protein